MKRWNVGFLGCGAIARTHALVFRELPNARIGAWWNRSPERAQALHAEFGGDYWTEDWERIINDPAIDAIYLNTMHNDRLRFLAVAARAQKPVFSEKPIAHAPDALRKMHALICNTGLHFHAGYKIRYHSAMVAARKWLPEPEILHAQVFDEIWPEGHLNDPAIAGGNVLCQGVYAAESLRTLAGCDPVRVCAMTTAKRHAQGTADTLAATFTFANGAVGTMAVADAGVAPEPISKFFITAAGGNRSIGVLSRYRTLVTHESTGLKTFAFEEDGFSLQTVRFFDCLERGLPPDISFRDGAIPSIMMWRAIEAAACGRAIEINIDGFLAG